MLYDALGLAGVAAILAAYALLQIGRLAHDSYPYLFLNGAGAALVLVSLLHAFNLAAFLLEAVWLAVTLYGAAKRWSRDRASGET